MDYKKLNKSELIEKLEEQKHLAKAVETKDKEIIILKKEVESLKETIKSETVPKEKYDAVNEALRNSVPKEKLEAMEADLKHVASVAVSYRNSFDDLIRLFKSGLDMAITTSELLGERVKTKKP